MIVEVYTKKELATAIKNKENVIAICDDDLAEKVKKFKGQPNLTKTQIATACVSGIEVVYIVGLIILGVVVLYALYKDYNVEAGSGKHKLKLKRA